MLGFFVRGFERSRRGAFTTVVAGGQNWRIRVARRPPASSALATLIDGCGEGKPAARRLIGILYRRSNGCPMPDEVILQLDPACCCRLLQNYPVRFGTAPRKSRENETKSIPPDQITEEDANRLAHRLAGQLLAIDNALLTADQMAVRWTAPH